MKKISLLIPVGLMLIVFLSFPGAALAQDVQPSAQPLQPLQIYTSYPSRYIGFGEVVTVTLKLSGGNAQMVDLALQDLPEGWLSSFRGGSQVIDAVYVEAGKEASVDLRLEVPADVQAGKYEIIVLANGSREKAQIPLRFTIQEKLPPRLSLAVDGLAVKKGSPSTTFNFSATLKNEGGEDLQVTLSASQPKDTQVTIQVGGQETTEIELKANETKNVNIKADPLINLNAGKYPITVTAQAGAVKSELQLTAEVIGEGSLSVTTPDGRLSGDAFAGKESPLKIALTNSGTAPLRGIELSSSEPSGWTLTFDQTQIAEIPSGETVQVTATIKPPENAVAGDYMITINARPLESKQQSAQFRITVRTSTLWGVAGIGLIALAVAVVGMAVTRFGRR